jgi:hypothetical protein
LLNLEKVFKDRVAESLASLGQSWVLSFVPFTATCISSVVFYDVGIGDHPKAVLVILVLEGGYECNLCIFIIFFLVEY